MDTCSEHSCSASESSPEDASKDEITNKFETYVKTVRIYAKPGVKRDEHLFDCCLLVGLNKRTPYIKMKFPENVSKHKITLVVVIYSFCVTTGRNPRKNRTTLFPGWYRWTNGPIR